MDLVRVGRRILAVLAAILAVLLVIWSGLAAYSLAETYSGDWDVVTSLTAMVGLLSAGLAVAARWLSERERPSVPVLVAASVVLTAVTVIVGNLIGDTQHVPPAERSSETVLETA